MNNIRIILTLGRNVQCNMSGLVRIILALCLASRLSQNPVSPSHAIAHTGNTSSPVLLSLLHMIA